MSSISAGTATGTALVQTADTTGALVIKTGGSAATAATFNADQTTTLAQPLAVASGGTGATSLSGITVGSATTATTATTATNLAGGSNGTIPYQSASGTTAMLAVGTSGQVLTSAGTSAPTWSTPSTGALVFISSTTVSGTIAELLITSGFTSTYDQYIVQFFNLKSDASSTNFYAQFYINSTLVSDKYYFSSIGVSTAGSVVVSQGGLPGGSLQFLYNANTLYTGSSFSGDMLILGANTSGNVSGQTRCFLNQLNNAYSTQNASFFGQTTTGVLTGIRFWFPSGNMTSGTFKLYGIAKS